MNDYAYTKDFKKIIDHLYLPDKMGEMPYRVAVPATIYVTARDKAELRRLLQQHDMATLADDSFDQANFDQTRLYVGYGKLRATLLDEE